METITISGDSLSMIRVDEKDPGKITYYQDTYPFKLQILLGGENYHIILKNQRRNHLHILADNLANDVLYNKSKYIIFHLGIVDCAPRLFGYFEDRILHVLARTPFLKIIASWLIGFKAKHRRFFTKYFPKVYTSEKEFKEKYSHIFKEIKRVAAPKRVFLINIADTSDKNKSRSYNFERNIVKYNEILKEVVSENKDFCQLIDFFSATKERKGLVLEDGIHLTKEGHIWISQKLYEDIKKADEE